MRSSRRSAPCARFTSSRPCKATCSRSRSHRAKPPTSSLGVSPRGALALLAAAQAAAAIDARDFVTPDDVKAVAPLVLAHRIIVRPEAELEGASADAVVARLLASVPAPT